jgi:hypothetical protein
MRCSAAATSLDNPSRLRGCPAILAIGDCRFTPKHRHPGASLLDRPRSTRSTGSVTPAKRSQQPRCRAYTKSSVRRRCAPRTSSAPFTERDQISGHAGPGSVKKGQPAAAISRSQPLVASAAWACSTSSPSMKIWISLLTTSLPSSTMSVPTPKSVRLIWPRAP